MGNEKNTVDTSSDLPKLEAIGIEQHVDSSQGQIDSHIDPVLSEKLDKKFDAHIVPWIFGIWLFAFIDRSNIGNARIVGLVEDLHIATGTGFNVALLVFYIPYILVDVPSNWAVKRVGAGVYLPSLTTAWGLASTFLGFARSLAGLVVVRLFLGAFEGGIIGAIVVYLAMFYRRHQMVTRVGYFYCAAPLSGAFGGLLATGLARIEFGGYKRWPWIFFIEGIATTLFGILCFFVMPHTPADAKFLTEEERALAMARMKMDSRGATREADVNREHFDWHWVRMAFAAPQVWFSCFIWFFVLIPLYSFSLFLPTIVSGLGYESTEAQLFTVPPNLAAFVAVLLVTRLSDRAKARGPFMVFCCLVAAAGYVMLLATHRDKQAVRYAGTFLVAIGVYPCSPLIIGWLSNNLAPHFVRATGLGFLIAFANVSAVVSTFIYLPRDKPDYVLGHSVSLGALVLAFSTVCAQMAYLRWENGMRERGLRDGRLNSSSESGDGRGDGGMSVERLGHNHPSFRYTM